MSTLKNSTKSKFISENINNFLNESQFLKMTPKKKKAQKRQIVENVEEDVSKIFVKKEKKMNVEDCEEPRQKILHVMGYQQEARKQVSDRLLKNLSEIFTQLEIDYDAMIDNEQKLEHLAGALIKCLQQTNTAFKLKLKALKEIHASYKKDVEGLLTRGAIKPDDRPLWFDVYKAFPPIVEPKFARPKPEVKPIKQILYQEDIVRAKFHSHGHGLAAVNMLNTSGETQTEKLIQKYEKLKSEGVPDNELIEKSVAAVGIERQQEVSKFVLKDPGSATSQIMAEANLKNIFNEK